MPTRNHGYHTPAGGTLDWHVLLNENFDNIDRDVEIRDSAGNRSNYAPKDGAKYLATDSGEVYLGDGRSWNYLGDIAPQGSRDASGRSASDGVIVAAPRKVQAALDRAGSNRMVRLITGETYRFDSPIALPSGATLDCNFASIEPGSDTDLFHIGTRSRVLNPRVDLRGISGYSSSVFVFDASGDTYYGPWELNGVFGGQTLGVPGEGTCIYFTQGGDGHFASFVNVQGHHCNGIGTFAEFYGHDHGHLNSNIVRATVHDPEILLHMHGGGDIGANWFELHVQPGDNSRRGWWAQAQSTVGQAIANNVLFGAMWDGGLFDEYEFITEEVPGQCVRNHILSSSSLSGRMSHSDPSNTSASWHELLSDVGV